MGSINSSNIILSKRGQKYDASTLKRLIYWARERNLIPGAQVAFEVSSCEAVGGMLWDCIASGGREVKEASKYATLIELRRRNPPLTSQKRRSQDGGHPATGENRCSGLRLQEPIVASLTAERKKTTTPGSRRAARLGDLGGKARGGGNK